MPQHWFTPHRDTDTHGENIAVQTMCDLIMGASSRYQTSLNTECMFPNYRNNIHDLLLSDSPNVVDSVIQYVEYNKAANPKSLEWQLVKLIMAFDKYQYAIYTILVGMCNTGDETYPISDLPDIQLELAKLIANNTDIGRVIHFIENHELVDTDSDEWVAFTKRAEITDVKKILQFVHEYKIVNTKSRAWIAFTGQFEHTADYKSLYAKLP